MADEGFKRLTERMRVAADGLADTPDEAFQAIGIAYVEFAFEHPSHFKVMFGPGIADPDRHEELRTSAREAFDALVSLVEACLERGLIEGGEAHQHALVAWSLVHGLSTLLVDGRIPPTQYDSVHELARFVTQVLREGMIKGS